MAAADGTIQMWWIEWNICIIVQIGWVGIVVNDRRISSISSLEWRWYGNAVRVSDDGRNWGMAGRSSDSLPSSRRQQNKGHAVKEEGREIKDRREGTLAFARPYVRAVSIKYCNLCWHELENNKQSAAKPKALPCNCNAVKGRQFVGFSGPLLE